MSVWKATSDLLIDCFAFMQQGCFIFWGCLISQDVEVMVFKRLYWERIGRFVVTAWSLPERTEQRQDTLQ
jgi:hypothetical protein